MKLTQADFKQRRDLLAKQIGSNSIAIIATRAEMYRNRDADYKYRADSSFYYLTGFAVKKVNYYCRRELRIKLTKKRY